MYILFYCICFIFFGNSATSSNESIPFDRCGECNGFYNAIVEYIEVVYSNQ